jgi:hypothetical protein
MRLRRLNATLNDRLAPKGGWHGESDMDVTQAVALAAADTYWVRWRLLGLK